MPRDDDDGHMGPPAKRQHREAPSFSRGTIKRIKVHNFMTYSGTVVIQPGPRLNLVLGPNGTGKSSLVCALCIGLGGSPKLLGRADNLRDYIQRGCTEAWTEVTLSGGPGRNDMVVRRDIKQVARDDGHSGYTTKWRLNGRDVHQDEIRDLIKELNIQFDNLCQFLPQDRVVEFARMNPFELLEATQKAIGDSHLYDQHQQLITKRNEAKTRAMSLAALQRQLSKLEAENKALERDAERFRKRQKLQRELEDINKKEVWLHVTARQEQVNGDLTALELARKLLKDHTDQGAGDAKPLKELKQRAKALKDQLQAMGPAPSAQSLAQRRRRLQDTMEDCINKYTAIGDRVTQLDIKSREWKDQIRSLRVDLGKKQAYLDALPPNVNHGEAIKSLLAEDSELVEKLGAIDNEMGLLQDQDTHLKLKIGTSKQRLTQLGSSRHRRLMAMDQRQGMMGVKELHEWLEDKKRAGGLFQGPVHGPLGLEITLVDAQRHARVVEAACFGMLFDFAVTCRRDEEILSDEMKRRGVAFRVHVHEGPLDAPYAQMSGPAHDYQRLGVQCTLADLVKAPPLVMQVLTSGPAALASSFLLADDLHLDELMRQPRIRTVYTPTTEYKVIKASYDNDHGRQSKELWQPHILAGAGQQGDEQAKAQETERLQSLERDLAGVQRRLRELEDEQAPLLATQRERQHRLQQLELEQRQSLQRRSMAQRDVLVVQKQLSLKERQADPLDSKPQLEQQQSALVQKHFEALMQLMQLVKVQWEGVRPRAALELAIREADMQIRAMEEVTNDRKEKEKELKDKVSKVQHVLQRSRAALERAQKQAQDEAPLNEALQRRLDALPDDRPELAERRQALEVEIAGIVCNNPAALAEYQERQRAIQGLQGDVTRDKKDLQDLNADIDTIKSSWLPELERVVGSINQTFSASFCQIGCAGEVHLDQGNGEDYDTFAIQIRVKFRDDEELQLLTGTRQSGGERSVSTILYLISLQDVTVTPFRVVDEINQGMDPVNERKVFTQLVRASTREGTPQCFLLTPKLLPDLEYTRDITVLQIMNGAVDLGAEGGTGAPRSLDLATLLGNRAAAMIAAR